MTTQSNIMFMGSKSFGLSVLKLLHSKLQSRVQSVVTLDDSADTRSVFPEFRAYCDENNLQLIVAKNRKDSEDIILKQAPDMVFVVGWYWLISEQLLSSVPEGFIGIHNSLLPKYRGGAPLVWQIINDEADAGFSVFTFTKGMDEGDIWAQGKVPIENTDTIADVGRKIEEKACEVLRDNCEGIVNKTIQPTKQDHSLATFSSQRIPDDGYIDWTADDRRIYNLIRAQSTPYPGARTRWNDKTVIIWKAQQFEPDYYGTPGQVAQLCDDGVFVTCGNHRAILLEEVEIDGVKGPARELLPSIKIRFS